jgi:hypothetical protein
MKKTSAAIFLLTLAGNITPAQAEAEFKYPNIIECTPTRAVGITLADGIIEQPELIKQVNHSFEYIQNGKYKYKSSYPVFSSKLSNQGHILNLYNGATSFSINIYEGNYISANSHEAMVLPDGKVVGGHASGNLFEGSCKIIWN